MISRGEEKEKDAAAPRHPAHLLRRFLEKAADERARAVHRQPIKLVATCGVRSGAEAQRDPAGSNLRRAQRAQRRRGWAARFETVGWCLRIGFRSEQTVAETAPDATVQGRGEGGASRRRADTSTAGKTGEGERGCVPSTLRWSMPHDTMSSMSRRAWVQPGIERWSQPSPSRLFGNRLP